MSNSNKIASLKALLIDLLDKALEELRLSQKEALQSKDKYYCIGEYFLREARQYITGSFEMLESGRTNASLALSRWVLEASLELLWAVADKNKVDERLNIIGGEALRNEACLLEGFGELWPDKSSLFKKMADNARETREDLGVNNPKPLNVRLQEIREQPELTNCPALYPLYRICCAAAHPGLKLWERFGIASNTIVPKEPFDRSLGARWMVAASAFYLVVFTYRLTGLGDSKQLKDWWVSEVQPLLNDD